MTAARHVTAAVIVCSAWFGILIFSEKIADIEKYIAYTSIWELHLNNIIWFSVVVYE